LTYDPDVKHDLDSGIQVKNYFVQRLVSRHTNKHCSTWTTKVDGKYNFYHVTTLYLASLCY